MRTTLTIDDDVEAALRQFCRESGLSWKDAVNRTLRRGLVVAGSDNTHAVYQLEPWDPGPPRLPEVTSVHELLEFAEGDDYQ